MKYSDTNLSCLSHQGLAIESHAASEDGLLQFEQGDVILVLAETQEVCVCSCKAYLISFGTSEMDEMEKDRFPVKSVLSFGCRPISHLSLNVFFSYIVRICFLFPTCTCTSSHHITCLLFFSCWMMFFYLPCGW